MKLSDVDLTVSEFFSKREGRRETGAASPRHKLSASPQIPIPTGTTDRRSCRPVFKALAMETTGHEYRMQENGMIPLVISGNREEIEYKEDLFRAVDPNYCDCCGKRLQRFPRQIAQNLGSLCPFCYQMLDQAVGCSAIEGPWTLLYGSASRVMSDRQFQDTSEIID